jgi:hypothetical protein
VKLFNNKRLWAVRGSADGHFGALEIMSASKARLWYSAQLWLG